jgi:hypothetical protein
MHPGIAILLLLAANVATVALMLLVRRVAPEGSFFHDTQQAAGVFTVAGTAYAVLLAFVFLLAFQSYNSARTSAEQEATAVTSLYHDADSLPEPGRSLLHGQLVCFGRSVIYSEWPAMGGDHSSSITQGWLRRLDETFRVVQPRTPKEQSANDQWTSLNSDVVDGRRGRLQEAKDLVPGLVWILLGIGSLVVVGFCALFADPRERWWVQVMLMVSVTTMLAAGLLLIRFFDRPYADVPGSIKPDAMQRTVVNISGGGLRAPCDRHGNPVTLRA